MFAMEWYSPLALSLRVAAISRSALIPEPRMSLPVLIPVFPWFRKSIVARSLSVLLQPSLPPQTLSSARLLAKRRRLSVRDGRGPH